MLISSLQERPHDHDLLFCNAPFPARKIKIGENATYVDVVLKTVYHVEIILA